MSLFSRIDRLRGGPGRGDDRDDDEGVFAIPDLKRASQSTSMAQDDETSSFVPSPSVEEPSRSIAFQRAAPEVEVVAPREVVSAPAPQSRREMVPDAPLETAPKKAAERLSPLERLSRRTAEPESEEAQPLMPEASLADPVVPERARPESGIASPLTERLAPSLSERLRAEPLPDVVAPPVAPTQRLAAQERFASSEGSAPEPVPARDSVRDEVASPRSSSGRPAFDAPSNSAARSSEVAPSGAPVPRESAAQRLARDERARTGAFAPEAIQARTAEPQTEALTRSTPPVSSSSAEISTSGGTGFDRLMAARAGTEPVAANDATRSSAPSLAQRLATMRTQEQIQPEPEPRAVSVGPEPAPSAPAPSASAPSAPAIEAVAPRADALVSPVVAPSAPESPLPEVEARREQTLPVAVTQEAPEVEARREAVLPVAVTQEAPEAELLPVEVAIPVFEPEVEDESPAPVRLNEEEAAFVTPALAMPEEDPARLVASDLDESADDEDVEDSPASQEFTFATADREPLLPSPVAAVEAEEVAPVAPPLPWNAPTIEDARPVPSNLPVPVAVAASSAAPAVSSLWAQRLAGRDALRDAPVAAPATPSLHAEPAPMETSVFDETLDRAAGQLARTGGEGVAGEAEGRNRSLYRQKHFIFDAVLGALDARTLQNATRESVKPSIERAVDSATREFNLSLDGPDRSWMIEEFVREVIDLGPLVGLLDDVSVNKVLVVGSTDVAVERLGRIERTGVSFRDDDHLLSVVRRIADLTGGRIDAKVPLLDRPLPDGARIRAKIPPLSPQPTLTVEKSTGNPFLALKRQQAERGRENALPYAQLRERIQQRLLREFEGNAAALGNPERLRTQVEEMIGLVIAEEKVAVTRAERASLVMDLLNEIVGLGPIEPLLNDPDVDEVMVNGPFQIYVERKGKLEIAPQRFRDNAHVMQVIERIVAPLGRRVDEKSPMVDGRLRDGSRFNAIIPPLALGGPTMTIRKFARDPLTMTDLINFGSLSREAAQFLQAAVEGRLNIIVSGGTGSGKTTTLNVLSSFIPSTERIVTIEDAAELQLRQEHIVRLETRPANIEGAGEIAIRDLVRNSLRMRPDRIVIGECRGGEALDMLQAMNTGHDGSLTTAHSNGPRDTVKRLETMVMMSGFDLPIRAIREQISMAVHLVVHQERMRDGKRRITAVTELVGMEGEVVTMQDIFRFEQERVDEEGRIVGSLNATGLRPHNYDKIVDNGGQISMDMFQPRTMGGRDGDLRSRLSEHRVGTR